MVENKRINCPVCDSEVDEDTAVCPSCRASLPAPPSREEDETLADVKSDLPEKERDGEIPEDEAAGPSTESEGEGAHGSKEEPPCAPTEDEKTEAASQKEEKGLKCPVCGAMNDAGAKSCKMCFTAFPEATEEGGKLKVKIPIRMSEEGSLEEFMKSHDPEEVKEAISELMLLPGMNHRKAIQLYRLGITDLSQLVSKAFPGDPRAKGLGRTLAHKLMLESIKEQGEEVEEEERVPCPKCGSLISPDSETCPVCRGDLEGEILKVDVDALSMEVEEFVGDVFEHIAADKSFSRMPEDLRAEIFDVLKDDDFYDEVIEEGNGIPEEAPKGEEEAGDETDKGEVPEDGLSTRYVDESVDTSELDKRMEALKMQAGSKGGEEGATEELVEEVIKVAAETKSKMDKKIEIYRKKLGKWRKKGFDPEELDELEKLLETDLKEFKRRSIQMLRKRVEKVKHKDQLAFQCPECGAIVDEDATKCPGCGVMFA